MAIKNLKNGVQLIDESSTHINGASKMSLDEQTIHLLDDVKQGLFEQLHQIDNMSSEELKEASQYFDEGELMLFHALDIAQHTS